MPGKLQNYIHVHDIQVATGSQNNNIKRVNLVL